MANFVRNKSARNAAPRNQAPARGRQQARGSAPARGSRQPEPKLQEYYTRAVGYVTGFIPDGDDADPINKFAFTGETVRGQFLDIDLEVVGDQAITESQIFGNSTAENDFALVVIALKIEHNQTSGETFYEIDGPARIDDILTKLPGISVPWATQEMVDFEHDLKNPAPATMEPPPADKVFFSAGMDFSALIPAPTEQAAQPEPATETGVTEGAHQDEPPPGHPAAEATPHQGMGYSGNITPREDHAGSSFGTFGSVDENDEIPF